MAILPFFACFVILYICALCSLIFPNIVVWWNVSFSLFKGLNNLFIILLTHYFLLCLCEFLLLCFWFLFSLYLTFWLREGDCTPLRYSCLENPMDGEAWKAAVHGVAKSQTQLSDFTFTFHFPALEKKMATHSSVLAWRIPGTGEPGGLPSMGSHRVGHDWSDLAAATFWLDI